MVSSEIQLSSVIASFMAILVLIIKYFNQFNFSGEIHIMNYIITIRKQENNINNQQGQTNQNHEVSNEIELSFNTV